MHFKQTKTEQTEIKVSIRHQKSNISPTLTNRSLLANTKKKLEISHKLYYNSSLQIQESKK
jgi:hypothetical protein